MPSVPPAEISIGIDFGTTNTVVALADRDGRVEALRFAHGGTSGKVFVTALCFWDERHGNGRRTLVEGGPWAIDRFLEGRDAHRFIQSFKTFAGSATFQETRIFRDRYRFEDLLATFLRTLKRHAGAGLDFAAPNVVVGRPVRFADYKPDDALAMSRYRSAFGALGARSVAWVVSPKLGKGSRYRSLGKTLAIPNHYYANFARWNQLAMMKSSGDLKDLRELERSALDPEPLCRFIDIIEYDLGFALYRAVNAAKFALSDEESTELRFAAEGLDIRARIARPEFESWIAEDVARIAATMDEALARARIEAGEVERVFLTGGTSFVPAIRRLFVERFGEERLTSADQFESIAYGLALIGMTEDPSRWAAEAPPRPSGMERAF